MKPDDNLSQDRQLAILLRRAWPAFFENFGRLTQVQRSTIPEILKGKDLLVCSATASGKTEAACAPLIESRIDSPYPWTILYISPTRALINDLYARLWNPLNRLGLRLKRRTGDYHDNLSQIPHVLLTTPESFDSLLCRGKLKGDLGHSLIHVNAIVLDEIHLLFGTARGEQVRWLIGRLRLLRDYAQKKGWIKNADLQIIGLSATLSNPNTVANTYLQSGELIIVPGRREIEIINPDKLGNLENVLPDYLETTTIPEKILVFCNKRKRVDNLASELRPCLSKLGYVVAAHHGSLSKKVREEAERLMKEEDKVVLFATSTLEIGVDIGNIDLVVLDEPAPDISALLQRIGRGNRRTNKTRVMNCINSEQESIIHTAMIEAARAGWLGTKNIGSQFAVTRQQVASYIFQAPSRSRSLDKIHQFLLLLAEPLVASSIIETAVSLNELIKDAKGLRLGEDWLEKSSRGDIHSNIEGLSGATVIDEMNGDQIASGVVYRSGKGLRTGGQLLEVKRFDERQIEVKRVKDQNLATGEWNYMSKAGSKGDGQAPALRWHHNICENEWPVIYHKGFLYVFHLGGASRSTIIELIYSEAQKKDELKVINPFFMVIPLTKQEIKKPLHLRNASSALLELAVESKIDLMEHKLGRPIANKKLSLDLRVEEVKRWLNIKTEIQAIRDAEWVSSISDSVKKALYYFIQ